MVAAMNSEQLQEARLDRRRKPVYSSSDAIVAPHHARREAERDEPARCSFSLHLATGEQRYSIARQQKRSLDLK